MPVSQGLPVLGAEAVSGFIRLLFTCCPLRLHPSAFASKFVKADL